MVDAHDSKSCLVRGEGSSPSLPTMKKVLVLVGPTASGKSSLAVKLAKKLKGEVISADSRQVYKGLDIGTGKITKKEMVGIPHYLLDVADPKKQFTVSDFKKLTEKKIEEILNRNKLPIIVGGTGFYVDTVTGLRSFPEVPVNIKLRNELDKKTKEELYKLLIKKDPRRAKEIDKNNKVRIIRALEIIEALGKVPKIKAVKPKYKFIYIGLKLPKEELNLNILKRLMNRLNNGMIDEAKKLNKKGLSFKRMEQLGLEYKYLAKYLKKEISKKELVNSLYKEIKQYARRQNQWFKTNKKIKWFEPNKSTQVEKYLTNLLK
jgi:tRNA dimethylallyltransferase